MLQLNDWYLWIVCLNKPVFCMPDRTVPQSKRTTLKTWEVTKVFHIMTSLASKIIPRKAERDGQSKHGDRDGGELINNRFFN